MWLRRHMGFWPSLVRTFEHLNTSAGRICFILIKHWSDFRGAIVCSSGHHIAKLRITHHLWENSPPITDQLRKRVLENHDLKPHTKLVYWPAMTPSYIPGAYTVEISRCWKDIIIAVITKFSKFTWRISQLTSGSSLKVIPRLKQYLHSVCYIWQVVSCIRLSEHRLYSKQYHGKM